MKIQLSEHFTYKKLIKFTLPTIIMMIFTSIYGVVDGIFVSNFIGSNAFAAINLIMPVLMIFGSIGFMIGTGGSALVSKTLGEGKKEKANEYFSMLNYFLIISGMILTIIGIIFIKPVSTWLGADGDLIEYCVTYGIVSLIGLIPYLLQNSFQSFLVVAEKPQMGLIISIMAGVTNMILDFVFIYLLKMGVLGAALATVVSQIVGGIVPFIYFARKNDSLLRLTKAKLELKPILKTSANGSSEMVTNLSMSLVNMLYNWQLMKYAGADGVVAYGIIMYISFIFVGTYLGYSVGAAPIIGYHYGAENKKELKGLLKRSLRLIGITSLLLTICAEILAKPLSSIFVSYDAELLKMTTIAIRIFSLSFIISGFNIFASSFFTALNNGFVSAAISFLRTLLFQIVMILILPLIFDLNGIWLAVVFAEILALIVSSIFLVYNKKKYMINNLKEGMIMKKIGFTIGKFAPFHKGHEYLIETALKETDELYIIIYDTDVIDVPVETRAKWISDKFKDVKIIYAYDGPKQYGLDKESVKIQMEYLIKKIKGIPVNCFYSSEPYGEKVAEYLNIENRVVDIYRHEVPISARVIRKDIEKHKMFLDEQIYNQMKYLNN